MEATCLNCNTEIVQNFCTNCGQKKYKRIDRKYIWDEVQYSTVHMNKGFFYSLKNTLKNPGKTARTFIDGNRVNHYKPMALAFVLSTLSTFISFKIIGLGEIMNSVYADGVPQTEFLQKINTFTQNYNAFLFLLLIPFFAMFTRWSFKSWGHNYYEHVIMNAYIISFYNLINFIIIYPLIYIFKENVSFVITMSMIAMFSFLIILPYFLKEFYSEYPFKRILKRLLLFFTLATVAIIILYLVIVIGMIVYLLIFSPETLQQFAPQKPKV